MSNRLTKLQNNISTSISQTIDIMLDKGSKVAKQKILESSHTQKEGDTLVDLIKTNKMAANKGVIFAGGSAEENKKMLMLEYGTGLVTKKHPDAGKVGWSYNVNDAAHRTSVGWFYNTTTNDKNENVIVKKNGKLVAFTKYSNPSRYMYNTKKYIKNNMNKTLMQKLGFKTKTIESG